MSRRRRPESASVLSRSESSGIWVLKFMNNLMLDGKKSVAERIVYGALETVEAKAKKDPVQTFHDALNNVKPGIEVRSRVRCDLSGSLRSSPRACARPFAIRWLISASHATAAKPPWLPVFRGELLDAANNRGNAVKKREDTHRMAEANRAFAHYRW